MTVKAAWRHARNAASHLIQLCLLGKCFQCKEVILWKPSFWATLKYNCHPVSWAHFSMLSSMNCVTIVPWILCLMFHISDVCNSGRLVEGLEARGLRGFIYEWMYLLTVAAGCSSRRTSHTRQETVLDPWVHVSWKSKSLWHFLWCCERETVLVFLLDLWFLVALKSHASIRRHHERNVEIHQSTKLTNCTKHDVILCSCEDLVSRLMGIWMHVLTVLIMWWITQRKELKAVWSGWRSFLVSSVQEVPI